jgi:hypothetical protein
MKTPSRRWLLRSGIGLLLALAAVQFVPYRHDRATQSLRRSRLGFARNSRVGQAGLLRLHSNETEWPVYSRIAPVSWLIQRDVAEGRAALNFSEWQRPQEDAGEAPEEIREREMPPAMYRLIHGRARLSAADRERLARGLANTLGEQRAGAHGNR